jgi:inorganic pyrophosphatase
MSKKILVNSKKNDEIYYEKGSFWHNIELKNNNGSINYVVEILPYTREKMEVDTEIKNNPIKLDRMYPNPIPFTYGCLPQTYESPFEIDPLLNIKGDDDPLDVCDITNLIYENKINSYKYIYPYSGQVKQGIILGMLAIKDKGMADWKIIVIDEELYNVCMDNGIKYILSDDIKKILKDWYDSDPKSEVIDFYENIEDINKVLEHTQKCYKKYISSDNSIIKR